MDLLWPPIEQMSDVLTQIVRILRARPDFCAIATDVGHRTGRADRRVLMVRPDVISTDLGMQRGQSGIDPGIITQHAIGFGVFHQGLMQSCKRKIG
ncbi:hypothetical protein D3C71_1510540 [compost metagenome]